MLKVDKQDIINSRLHNPCATLQQIGDKYGITRERVRQILESENLNTTHWKQKYKCLQCGEIIERSRSKSFCSKDCQYNYSYPLIECCICKKLVRRNQGQLYRHDRQNKHYFCSKKCKGTWFGLYGAKRGKQWVK